MPSPSSDRLHVSRASIERWRADPVLFGQDLFGLRFWSGQQALLRAAGNPAPGKRVIRASCTSGHKTGKSTSFAVLAWRWFLTRPGSPRVVILAPTYRQVEEVIWREVVNLYGRGERRLQEATGKGFGTRIVVRAHPEDGVQNTVTGAQIIGMSTDTKPERLAGISGDVLYLPDEASGIPRLVHETISASPSANIAMASNPTENEGVFYDSHHSKSPFWSTLCLSSEACARENRLLPNGEYFWPYLATPEYVEEKRAEYGDPSPYYDVRIRGVFATGSLHGVISREIVDAAKARWESTQPSGPIEVGVDPGRFGDDPTCIVWRRGNWSAPPMYLRGEDSVSVAGKVLELVASISDGNRIPVVRVDVTGSGGGVADNLRRHSRIMLTEIQAHQDAQDPIKFASARDEIWFRTRDWLRDGGAIASDERLETDLKAPLYDYDDRNRIKVESKRKMRSRLGRSPDAADALGLAIYAEDVIPIDAPPAVSSPARWERGGRGF